MQNSSYQSPRAHILIVGRNQGALALLENMFCWKGYQVTTAADGLDGLEKYRHGCFNLILTNLSTSRISGWELGRLVKESTPSLPVALVTGLDFDTRPDHSPFDAIIPVPFHFDDLHCVVDSLIQCNVLGGEEQSPQEIPQVSEGGTVASSPID